MTWEFGVQSCCTFCEVHVVLGKHKRGLFRASFFRSLLWWLSSLDPSRHIKRCFSRQPHCSSELTDFASAIASILRFTKNPDPRQAPHCHALGGRRRSCAQPSAFPTSSWLLRSAIRRDQTFATQDTKFHPIVIPARHGCSCAAIISGTSARMASTTCAYIVFIVFGVQRRFCRRV